MKIICWNVNGLKSLIKAHNLNSFLETHNPDIFCMSEIKLTCPINNIQKKLEKNVNNYKFRYWSPCITKKGYSGTTIWCKTKPTSITQGMGVPKHDNEGRIISVEFENYFLIHVYAPNSGDILQRLKYRTQEWDVDFLNYIKKIGKLKPVIVCGDLNVAHREIDIHDPIGNRREAGFTKIERENFTKLLVDASLTDSFRYLYPDEKDQYTYWSFRYSSRKKNKGWRLDYFLVSDKIKHKVKDVKIISEQQGSDHAPLQIDLSLT
ncbi:Endonuclease/Exonuclease/phosphatase family [seawater metagenome]|uniref:Endonuclease/Exonuclease/phosphatase family n=1 Tax=seawater metagenome TaxID=1561972 RepID=A0A5E8CJ57_9ZZZZ